MRLRGFRARLRGGSESNAGEPARLPERPIGRYVLALVLIAVLAVLSTFTTYRALSAQEKDATVLEYGLRQGYLATRVAELSAQIVDGGSGPLYDELVASTGEIVRIHESFLDGDPALGIPALRGTAAGSLLEDAGVELEGFLTATDQAVAALERQGRAPVIFVENLGEAAALYGLTMQRVVTSYQRVSGEQVVDLEQTEYFLLAATLVLLVLEGLFLFRPAVRNLKQSWTENTEAHRYERELDQQQRREPATRSRPRLRPGDPRLERFQAPVGALTEEGQVIDASIYESVLSVMEATIPEYVVSNYIRERSGATLPNVAPSNIYSCKDGAFLIAANQDTVFRRLAAVIGQPELADDELVEQMHDDLYDGLKDEIVEGEMRFDYRLQPGIVTAALERVFRLIELGGEPVAGPVVPSDGRRRVVPPRHDTLPQQPLVQFVHVGI